MDVTVFSGNHAKVGLMNLLTKVSAAGRQMVILTDTNTLIHCLPVLRKKTGNYLADAHLITIPAGEQHKTIETASDVWKQLAAHNISRSGLLINLGGGVVTDLGGFVASTYKRGIETIHIPTTLMGMADAAIGGKTGVDLESIKNLTGTFYPPKAVYIFPEFLNSLPEREILQAHAEVLKYGFIHSPDLLSIFPVNSANFEHIIAICASIKSEITAADPKEKGVRKMLNFGHTIGHAFESTGLAKKQYLLHGEAVAAGLVCELYLSYKLSGLDKSVLDDYVKTWLKYFPQMNIGPEDYPVLMHFIANDKKNMNEQIMFTLIQSPGQAVWNIPVKTEDVFQSFDYYRSVCKFQ